MAHEMLAPHLAHVQFPSDLDSKFLFVCFLGLKKA